MPNTKYEVHLTPRKLVTTIIRFESLDEREEFLRLLNKSSMNASMSLFKNKQEEIEND